MQIGARFRVALFTLLLAAQFILPACASAGPGFGNGFGFNKHHLPKVSVGVFNTVSYDTSIGLGVDASGRADLTPRVGAQIFYTNSTTGSDSNTCTQAKSAATPKATIKSAETCVVDGEGDHVLIAQGMSYPNGFAYVGDKGGFSPQYPVVYQSYDPADPTNQAKWGTATGTNRPAINMASGADNSGGFIQGSGTSKKYRAFRGLKFDGQNASAVAMNVLTNTLGTPDYVLFESDEFAQVQLSIEGDNTVGNIRNITNVIIRSCSSHGQWDSSGGGRAQGVFISTAKHITIEDSVLWRAGWKEGALRTDSSAAGGPSNQAHSLYFQDDTRLVVVRRNAFIDNSFEGVGQLKGGGVASNNLILRNPIVSSTGGGNNYTVDAPLGVYSDFSYNAVLGAGPSTDTGDWGIHLMNARQIGSAAHHNVLARSGVAGAYALMIDAANDLITDPTYHSGWSPNTTAAKANPSTGNFYNNVSYLWSPSGQTKGIGTSGGNLGLITTTFNNNVWDDPASGSNVNVSSATFGNAYTEATLLAALPGAYASETAAVADWVANPQAHSWRTGPSLMLAGYGVTPVLADLVTDTRITVGVPTSGQFIGELDGSTLSATGLPSCVTIDNASRSWTSDGTCTAGTPSSTVTETNALGTHNTTLNWTVGAQPVLSSLTVTPSSTTATASISTNTGSGNLYWMASTKSLVPDWPHLRMGIDGDEASAGKAYSSQAVSTTGLQSIAGISGLAASTTYYLDVFQNDGGNNPSAVSQFSFTTTSGAWTPASLGTNLVVWYEPGDLTTLYQDTGCSTTPVTADLQTVKCIKDKSGNGFNATNSTGWVYHAGAHPYLAMDGSTYFSIPSMTFADATGQYAAWAAANVTSSANMFLLTDGSGNSLFQPNPATGAMNFHVRNAAGTDIGNTWSAGVIVGTDQVYAGVAKGTSGTSGTVEAFVNGVDTPGGGVVAWSGTPALTRSFRLNAPTTSAGKLYALFIAKGDQTANLSSAETYAAGTHP